MILHSVIPADAMAQMILQRDAAENAVLPPLETRAEGQRYLEGHRVDGKFVVCRIISTNPADFL